MLAEPKVDWTWVTNKYFLILITQSSLTMSMFSFEQKEKEKEIASTHPTYRLFFYAGQFFFTSTKRLTLPHKSKQMTQYPPFPDNVLVLSEKNIVIKGCICIFRSL